MNQNITNHGKVYEITRVDETGTKFILTSDTGEQVALGIDAAVLDVYTKQVTFDMENFAHIEDLKSKISNVDAYLANNGAYLRMKELVPTISISNEVLTKRINDLTLYFEKKYPNKVNVVTPVEVEKPAEVATVETTAPEITPEDVTKEPSEPSTATNDVVPVAEVEKPMIFTPIKEINGMLLEHDQNAILHFLKNKYENYEVNADFTVARDPRDGATYRLYVDTNSEVKMINTNQNLNRKSDLTDTQKIKIHDASPEELNEIINGKDPEAAAYALEVKNGLKKEYGVEDTMLIEPVKAKRLARQGTMGFISHLAVSFLVGVLGGVSLMVVGNSIMSLF